MSFEVSQNSSPQKKSNRAFYILHDHLCQPQSTFIVLSETLHFVSPQVFLHQVKYKFLFTASLSRIQMTPAIPLVSTIATQCAFSLSGEAENDSCSPVLRITHTVPRSCSDLCGCRLYLLPFFAVIKYYNQKEFVEDTLAFMAYLENVLHIGWF